MGLETAAILAISAGVAGGAGAAISGAEQASAAKSAAETTSAAAEKAAELQSETAAKTLAFQKQQAEADWRNQEATRQANYNQWVASRQGAGSLRAILGLPGLDIPAYVPSTDPGYTTGGTPLPSSATTPTSGPMPPGSLGSTLSPSSATGPAGTPPGSLASTLTPTGPGSTSSPNPSGDPKDPAFIQANLAKVYSSLGVQPTGRGTGPTDIAYYADQVASTGGWTGDNANYWTSRIQSDLSKAKGGGAGNPGGTSPEFTSSAYQPGTLGSMMPTGPQILTPQLGY